ncbi:MAG: micrococcal nuclease [Microgenomates group bacterium Gr01-1014_7]|nr:MAG: micrococcal nuclease [Microgenomates group bacterium Gr01-1014_7]
MSQNTKLLVSFSFIIIFFGLTFLFFGLNPKPEQNFSPQPTTSIVETAPIATTSAVVGIEGERVLVTKVVDGDTIEVSSIGRPASGWEGEKTIRFIGIDTPETVDPRRPVGCFGKEASNKTKGLLSGKEVILQKDITDKDKYGRLLRYIYLPLENGQTLFVNDYLVREGFASVLTYPPDVKYNEEFRGAEKEAKEGKKGLWGRCK